MYRNSRLLYEEEYYKIVGLCIRIHNKLGCRHKEFIYQDALEVELIKNNIPYEREKAIPIFYDGVKLKHNFRADFLVYGCIVIEIKAIKSVSIADFKQTLNYIKATDIELAILINFGSDRLTHQRIISSNP
jgi:GxxExxY protein